MDSSWVFRIIMIIIWESHFNRDLDIPRLLSMLVASVESSLTSLPLLPHTRFALS